MSSELAVYSERSYVCYVNSQQNTVTSYNYTKKVPSASDHHTQWPEKGPQRFKYRKVMD